MRYGVISDVHGNLAALQAVVRELRERGVDGWLCAGDLVGYGPHPNECVETVLGLDARTVAGNHDLIALGLLSGERSSARAQRSHEWTREALRDDVRAAVEALPRVLEHDGVVVAHGSLHDPEEYVNSAERRENQLALLARDHPSAQALVLGHTHKQHAQRDARLLLNPGSVGQSRQWEAPPRARAAILDRELLTVELIALTYPLLGQLRAGRRERLGYRAIHSPAPLHRVLVRRTRRLLG